MRHAYLSVGAGCLAVFALGAGFALAQQGAGDAEPVDPDAADAPVVDAGPADSGVVDAPVGAPAVAARDRANMRPSAKVRAAQQAVNRRRADGGPLEGGPVLTFGISSTLSATDNYSLHPSNEDSTALFDTGLSFGYQNRRAIDELTFGMSGMLRAIEPPRGGGHTFDDRRARLNYDREGVNSRFGVGLDYDFSSVDALDPFEDDRFFEDDPLDETDLSQGRGDRQQIGARFSFETGLNDPLGFILNGRYRDRSYSDTTDPDLYDTEIVNLSGTARLTLSPVTETRLVLSHENYDADDAARTIRRTNGVNVGLTQALSRIDSLNASIGYRDIETEETILGTRRTTSEGGLTGNIGWNRELSRGSIGTTFEVSQSENGQSATWLLNRALVLPRGAIDLSGGITSDVDETLRPVGSLDFTYRMPRSSISASLSRQVSTSSQSNELRTTEASLGYNYQINSLSDLSFVADYAETERIGGSSSRDTIRTNLRATYSRALTRDWQLSSGYEYRMRDETGTGTATSNRVFVTLQRDFAIRP